MQENQHSSLIEFIRGDKSMKQIVKLSLIFTLLIMLILSFSACDSGETEEAVREDEPITETASEVSELIEILENLSEDDKAIIELEKGSYDQEIIINDDFEFEELTLIAEEEYETEINASVSIFDNKRVTLKDFEITESEGNAIHIENSEKITIENNIIENNDYFGIIGIESNVEIIKNRINNNGLAEDYPGVKIEKSSDSLIENNEITNNNNNGIEIFEDSTSEIINNKIIENENNGVYINNESHSTLKNNSIKENQIHGIMNSNASIIARENVINNNNSAGILIKPKETPFETWEWNEDNEIKIEDNEIKFNKIAGIENWAGEGSLIQNNSLKGKVGISIMDYLKPMDISVEDNHLNNKLPFFLQDTKENSFRIEVLNNDIEPTKFNQEELENYLQDGDVRYENEEPEFIHLFYLADPEYKNENLIGEIFENNNEFIPDADRYNIDLIDYEKDHTGEIIGIVE